MSFLVLRGYLRLIQFDLYLACGNFQALYDKVRAYPPGCVVILPGDTAHFHWAKSGEYVTQVTAIGPLGLEYFTAEDDPRNNDA